MSVEIALTPELRFERENGEPLVQIRLVQLCFGEIASLHSLSVLPIFLSGPTPYRLTLIDCSV